MKFPAMLLCAVTLAAGFLREAEAKEPGKKSKSELTEALKDAIMNDDVPEAKRLLREGADPNARYDAWRETPLMYAQSGAMVDALVERGADLHAVSGWGQSVIQVLGGYELAPFLSVMRHGVPFDARKDGPSMLVGAVTHSTHDLLKWLLEHGADPNTEGFDAVYRGKALTSLPLETAVFQGDEIAAGLLLKHGAKPGRAEIQALDENKDGVLKVFREHGVGGISELCYAVSQDAPVARLQKMIAKGAPVNPPQDGIITPLAQAARRGNFEAVKFLVEHGADVNKGGAAHEDQPGLLATPLSKAAAAGNEKIVEYLLKHGAVADYSALREAVYHSLPGEWGPDERELMHSITLLLDAGALKKATPEQQGDILNSAIQTSRRAPNETVLRLLLARGLSPALPMPGREKPVSIIDYYRNPGDLDDGELARFTGMYKPMLAVLEQAREEQKTATPR